MIKKEEKCREKGHNFFLIVNFTLYQTLPGFIDAVEKPYENNVGKGENAGSQHFLSFPTLFSSLSGKNSAILATFNIFSLNG